MPRRKKRQPNPPASEQESPGPASEPPDSSRQDLQIIDITDEIAGLTWVRLPLGSAPSSDPDPDGLMAASLPSAVSTRSPKK